ncbi:MAG: V-type ATP synthase subunit E [Sedimentisphaerales bacterium]
MDANQVVEKILSEAQAGADKIKSAAEQKAGAFRQTGDAQLAEYQRQTEQLVLAAETEEKNRVLATARLAAGKELIQTKRDLLDSVIERAGQTIKKLGDAEYLSLMESLMLKAVRSGSEEVVIDKNETRINDAFVGKINKKLSAEGKNGGLHLSADRADIKAGFILKQDKTRVNAALDVLLKQAAGELEGKLAELLFGRR